MVMLVTLDLTSYRCCLCGNVGEYEAMGVHSVNKLCLYVRFRRRLNDFFLIFMYVHTVNFYCLLFICTNKCIYYIYIYRVSIKYFLD